MSKGLQRKHNLQIIVIGRWTFENVFGLKQFLRALNRYALTCVPRFVWGYDVYTLIEHKNRDVFFYSLNFIWLMSVMCYS